MPAMTGETANGRSISVTRTLLPRKSNLAIAHAALPRFPQPYGDRIVFVADGNVWSVAKTGGTAERLTSAGNPDGEANIANKLSRGGFSAAYFLQCLDAIGSKVIIE